MDKEEKEEEKLEEQHIKKEEVLENLNSSDTLKRNLGIMEKIEYLRKNSYGERGSIYFLMDIESVKF